MTKREKPHKRSQRELERKRQSRQVFVAYSSRISSGSEYRKVYEAIETSYDVTFIFSDEEITDQRSMKKMGSLISGSDFAVFDVSGWDPTVALQLGHAMALGDQWYILVDPSKGVPGQVAPDFRGLGRIEFSSPAELGEKLGAVVAKRYARRPGDTIDGFLAEQRRHVVGLVRRDALPLASIAQLLGVDVAVAELIVRPLLDEGVVRANASADAGTTTYSAARASERKKEQTTSDEPRIASGDGGEPLVDDTLNQKEKRVLDLLRRRGTELHLDEIGAACFRSQKASKANSWARNSLRRLVSKTLARKVGRGVYAAVT